MSTPTTVKYTDYSWTSPDGLLCHGSAPICDVTRFDKLTWEFVVTDVDGHVIYTSRRKQTYNNVQLAVEKVINEARFNRDNVHPAVGLDKLKGRV